METRLGQAALLVVAMEAIPSRLPLVAKVEAVAEGPWLFVMPRGSLSFQASPGGLLVPVGCPVLFVWPWSLVMYCSVCLAPEGSWYPLTSPGNFFWGVEGVPAVGAGPRGPRPRPPKTICHGLQSSLHRHGLQSSQLRHGLQISQLRHGLQSSQLRHGLRCLFRSGGPRPVFLSVFVLRGLQSAHPPSPVELLRRGTLLPGGGSYVRVLLCVICSCLLCPYLVCFLSLFHVIMS